MAGEQSANPWDATPSPQAVDRTLRPGPHSAAGPVGVDEEVPIELEP
jgi:hypothetical protein